MGKTVLVTGGTGSIGREIVRRFCGQEHTVFFQFFQNTRVAESIQSDCPARPIRFDLRSIPLEMLPKVDILVNNAAINIARSTAESVTDDEWESTLAVNLTAPFRLVRHYLPQMIKRRWGRIINISSIYGLRSSENNLPYTASKHGLNGLTRTIAREYAALGITSNEICPGPVESNLMNRIAEHSEKHGGATKKEYLDEIVSEIPARRMATPSDVAELAIFLASDSASYINGASLTVDGGLIA